jgi:hypothetical protein
VSTHVYHKNDGHILNTYDNPMDINDHMPGTYVHIHDDILGNNAFYDDDRNSNLTFKDSS